MRQNFEESSISLLNGGFPFTEKYVKRRLLHRITTWERNFSLSGLVTCINNFTSTETIKWIVPMLANKMSCTSVGKSSVLYQCWKNKMSVGKSSDMYQCQKNKMSVGKSSDLYQCWKYKISVGKSSDLYQCWRKIKWALEDQVICTNAGEK